RLPRWTSDKKTLLKRVIDAPLPENSPGNPEGRHIVPSACLGARDGQRSQKAAPGPLSLSISNEGGVTFMNHGSVLVIPLVLVL
ncbi:MAG: hypothetical protein ACP5CD_07455, partial [Thermovirgaceae bacterium]